MARPRWNIPVLGLGYGAAFGAASGLSAGLCMLGYLPAWPGALLASRFMGTSVYDLMTDSGADVFTLVPANAIVYGVAGGAIGSLFAIRGVSAFLSLMAYAYGLRIGLTLAIIGPYSFALMTVRQSLGWEYFWNLLSFTFIWWVLIIVASLGIAAILPKQPDSHCCRRCSYDLTGNVSGVYPECGTKIVELDDS